MPRASLIVVEFRLARIDHHADVVIVVADQVTRVLGNRLIRFIEDFILDIFDFDLRILVDCRSSGGGCSSGGSSSSSGSGAGSSSSGGGGSSSSGGSRGGGGSGSSGSRSGRAATAVAPSAPSA